MKNLPRTPSEAKAAARAERYKNMTVDQIKAEEKAHIAAEWWAKRKTKRKTRQ